MVLTSGRTAQTTGTKNISARMQTKPQAVATRPKAGPGDKSTVLRVLPRTPTVPQSSTSRSTLISLMMNPSKIPALPGQSHGNCHVQSQEEQPPPITILMLQDKNQHRIACKALLDQCCTDKGLIFWDIVQHNCDSIWLF